MLWQLYAKFLCAPRRYATSRLILVRTPSEKRNVSEIRDRQCNISPAMGSQPSGVFTSFADNAPNSLYHPVQKWVITLLKIGWNCFWCQVFWYHQELLHPHRDRGVASRPYQSRCCTSDYDRHPWICDAQIVYIEPLCEQNSLLKSLRPVLLEVFFVVVGHDLDRAGHELIDQRISGSKH